MNAAPQQTSNPAILRWIGLSAVFGVLLASVGCSDKKKEATEVIEKAVESCRKAEGTFHDVSLMNGSDKQQVLAATCHEKLGEVKLVDEFSAEATVGPYLWRAALNDATGVWTMQSVRWETLRQARQRLENREAGENVLRYAAKQLEKAQEEYPKSGWIRLERLETLLRMRTLDRETASSGLEMKKAVETQLSETLDWAQQREDRATEARARLQAVDYYRGFREQIEDALGAMGSQDVHLERSAKLAEERGNEKEAEKYRKELEKLEEKRPEKRKNYEELLEKTRSRLCERLEKLSPKGIENSTLRSKIEQARGAIDCSKGAGSSEENTSGEEGNSETGAEEK